MTKLHIAGRKYALLGSVALAAGGFAGQAHAAAFYLQEQSTVAIGRAFSGEVSEQGAAQQWWNPAATGGITGIQNYVGITAILPHANATNIDTTLGASAFSPGGSVGGVQNDHNPVHNGYLPNGGFAVPLGDKFDFGFTMTSPYSFTTNYGDKDWARYGADKSRLRTFDFQPSFAFHTGGLSIGAGPNIEYLRATLSNFLPDPLAPQVNPDGHQYLKGSGWDVGYSVGFQFHNDKVDLGASYKSAIKHTLDGHLIISGIDPTVDPLAAIINQHDSGAQAHFTTPWQVDLGMRYHITPQLTINGQINRFGWDKFGDISLTGLPALLGTQVIGENYHNTFSYALGFDYKMSPKLTVRGGVQRDMSPISNGNRDPRVPDGNRWNFATGASYEMNQFMGLDVAASYDKIKSGTIDKSETLYANTILASQLFNDGYLHDGRAIVLSLGGHLNF